MPKNTKTPDKQEFSLELVMGVGPMNLVITNDALYQLSYTSTFSQRIDYSECILGMQAFYCSEMEEAAKSQERPEKKRKSVFRV